MQTALNTKSELYVRVIRLSEDKMVHQGGVKRRRDREDSEARSDITASSATSATPTSQEGHNRTESNISVPRQTNASVANSHGVTPTPPGPRSAFTPIIRKATVLGTLNHVIPVPPEELLRRMLEEKIETDWTIVSSDGKEFACHKAVLSVQIPHFRHLFGKKDSWEVTNKQIKMTADMALDAEAVTTFLRYIYYRDTALMVDCPRLICAMIRIGHYCSLTALTDAAVELLLRVEDHGSFKTALNDLATVQHMVRRWNDNNPLKNKLSSFIVKVVMGIFEIPSTAP